MATSPFRTDASSSGPGYGIAPVPAPAQNPYGTAILTDPLFQQLQAQIAAQNQGAQAAAQTGFGQALAGYGQIPDLTQAAQQLGLDANSPLYGILTGMASNPNITGAAKALSDAGLSTSAQLAQQHQTAIQTLLNNLAARGAVQSGDTGVGLRLEDQANAQRQYDASQTLLQNLGKLIGTYNNTQQSNIQQLQQGAAQAAARQIALNPNVSPTAASGVASTLTVPSSGVASAPLG